MILSLYISDVIHIHIETENYLRLCYLFHNKKSGWPKEHERFYKYCQGLLDIANAQPDDTSQQKQATRMQRFGVWYPSSF